jgi:hypothetical protein
MLTLGETETEGETEGDIDTEGEVEGLTETDGLIEGLAETSPRERKLSGSIMVLYCTVSQSAVL